MATKKAVWQGYVTDSTGAIVPNAEIHVKEEASGAYATLYADRDGTAWVGGNPFTIGSDGFVQFYVDPSRVRIEAYKGGLVAQFDDVLVGIEDRWLESRWCTVTEGTNDAYVLTTAYDPASAGTLYDGMLLRFRAPTSNTGSFTINLDGLGAQPCVPMNTGVAMPAGYLRTDVDTVARWDAANSRWVVDREIEFISNSNGTAARYANGRLTASKGNLSLPYFSASFVEGVWTFPAVFNGTATLRVTATISKKGSTPRFSTSGATPATDEMGGGAVGNYTTTNCQVTIWRVLGLTGFQSGDIMNVDVEAEGFWYA